MLTLVPGGLNCVLVTGFSRARSKGKEYRKKRRESGLYRGQFYKKILLQLALGEL
jgi:hypothetical protein